MKGSVRGGATERVTGALREAIATLELRPGQAIDKESLMERFGVSRFAIAEALKRLGDAKLVDVRPQSGSSISFIQLADAHENLFLRRALEAEMVEALCHRDNAALVADLRHNLRCQKAVVDRPLQASLLVNLATVSSGAVPGAFRYRGIAPAIAGRTITVNQDGEDPHAYWTEGPAGVVRMAATAEP